MNLRRFAWIAAAALATSALSANSRELPAYPTKPIKVIVPSPPGTPPDIVARLIGDKLSVELGQPVVVENRPGATGIIGLQAVARAAPDGYTLGVTALPFIVVTSLVSKMPYDTEKDLAPITLVDWHYNILAVTAGSSMKSVADLVATAKAKPGQIKYASAGNGTPSHLGGELLKREFGIDIMHIPYKGAPAGILALLAGDVDMMIGATGAMSPHIKSGKLRALATTAPQRIAAYPDLPTFAELGYPGISIRDWQGFVAPARTPKSVITRLDAAIERVTAMPEVKARLARLGMETASAGPEQFAAHIHAEMEQWSKLIRETGIKAD